MEYDTLHLKTLRLRRNGRLSTETLSNSIFSYENYCILILISRENFPNRPIINKPSLVQMMAWHRTGDKALPETMMA